MQGNLAQGGTPLCKWRVKSDVSLGLSSTLVEKFLQRLEATYFKAVVDIIWMTQVSVSSWLEEGKQTNISRRDLEARRSSLGLACPSVGQQWFLTVGETVDSLAPEEAIQGEAFAYPSASTGKQVRFAF